MDGSGLKQAKTETDTGPNLAPNCNGPTLPVELYQIIFGFVFKMEVENFEELARVHLYVRTPLTLGAVCVRWRSVVLAMPELWTFMYCEASSSKSKKPGVRSQVMRYLRMKLQHVGLPFTCLSNAQNLFLECSANLPLRVYILTTSPDHSLAAQIHFLHYFPSQRIRQLSLRTHDLHERFVPGRSLLLTLFDHLNMITHRLLDLPALEIIDLFADTWRRSTRAVFHRSLVRPDERPKLLKVAIYGEEFPLWYGLAGQTSGLTHLTLSNTGLGPFQSYSALLDAACPSVTYLELVNLSWASMSWDDLFARLTNLTYLRLEQTRPLPYLTRTLDSDLNQAAHLECALDTLPVVVNSLTCLSEIELITDVPVSAGSLILFIVTRLESVEVEVGQLRVVVSRATFTPSEISSLRAVSIVEIV